MNKNKNENSAGEINRRNFLGKLAIGSMTGVGFMTLLGSLDLPIPRVIEATTKFKVGRIVDFPLNAYTFIEGKNVFVFHNRKMIKALSAVCTHLGCVVKKTQHGFECPCHGSCYDQLGKVTSGPAPRSLEWFQVKKSPEGQLIIDTSKRVDSKDGLLV